MKTKTLLFGLLLLTSPALAVPDLEVSSVLGPPGLTAGDPLSLTWSIVNSGADATPSGLWLDAVYLSSDSALDVGDLLLGGVNHVGLLSTGEGYSTNLSLMMSPTVPAGDYYFLVSTDALGVIPESGESNNVGTSSRVTVHAAVPEPSTLLLLGCGLAVLGVAGRRPRVR